MAGGAVEPCFLARKGRQRQTVALGPGQRETSETVAKQKQLPSTSVDSMCEARAQKMTLTINYCDRVRAKTDHKSTQNIFELTLGL